MKPQFHRNLYLFDGRLSQRIWARGIVTDYAYDGWNNLTNTTYSDDTPMVTLFYDAMGRQIEAEDAAGATTFRYDSFGALANETVVGIAGTNTIIRHWDAYCRTTGYSLVGRVVPSAPQRQTTIGYDSATGRIATMLANGSDVPFTWSYLSGSDLKSSLAYPSGLVASWQYDAKGQLLQVCNAFPTNVISQYDYTYDVAGRRVACGKSGSAFAQNDTLSYGYNEKSELTNAVAAVDSDYRYAYDFDEIGNRETSSECGTNSVYTANNLNQYNAVDDFTPQFDDDGNQTLIQTSTGIWSVTYNGENRPIHWQCQQSNNQTITNNQTISMSFDRMGRRVTKNDQRFVYNGYLQIANFEHQTSNFKLQTFIWDPTEPVATRPLAWLRGNSVAYYTHDGNKNVSEVVAENGDIAAHYEYAPFGSVTAQSGVYAVVNPWRFSSEYAEDDTAMVYYNYRHYEPIMGRWLSRDPIEENGGIINIYLFLDNTFGRYSDWLGQFPILPIFQTAFKSALRDAAKSFVTDFLTSFYDITLDNGKLVGDAIWSCGSSKFEFHDIKLNRPGDSSAFISAFQKGAWNGITSLATETLTGSLSEIIRKNASKFLMAKRGSPYYKYYKKIEKLITKEGAQELTDKMVNTISELAISQVSEMPSLITDINFVPDEEQEVKWTIEDKCRICAIIKESFTVTMTIMGERQQPFPADGPEKKRCFDYEELGTYGPPGRGARKACGLCPCEKK